MAISLNTLKSSKSELPPRILIHAVEGVGKTSLASQFPNPVYLSTRGEQTPGDIEIPTPGQVESFADVIAFINELGAGDHTFETLIIDSLDGFEPFVWAETAVVNKWPTGIEEPGFGKGYLAADTQWREFLGLCDALREARGMTIILIAHSDRVNHEEPGHPPYKRYDLRLQKRAQALICDWSDFIIFVNTKVTMKAAEAGFGKKTQHAEGGTTRWIYTDARPAFVAKNRGAKMPSEIMFNYGEGFKALAKYTHPQHYEAMVEASKTKESTKKAAA